MPRNRYVLVFAGTIAEANRYAKRAQLPRGGYRAVGHAASITGIQVADVHELPSFSSRPDRHAIRAKVRHGRDIRYIDVEMPPPLEAPPTDQGDGMGEQLSLDDLEPVGRDGQGAPLYAHQLSETEKLLADQAAYAEAHAIMTEVGLVRETPTRVDLFAEMAADLDEVPTVVADPALVEQGTNEELDARDLEEFEAVIQTQAAELEEVTGVPAELIAPNLFEGNEVAVRHEVAAVVPPASDEDAIKAAAIKKPRARKPVLDLPEDF